MRVRPLKQRDDGRCVDVVHDDGRKWRVVVDDHGEITATEATWRDGFLADISVPNCVAQLGGPRSFPGYRSVPMDPGNEVLGDALNPRNTTVA